MVVRDLLLGHLGFYIESISHIPVSAVMISEGDVIGVLSIRLMQGCLSVTFSLTLAPGAKRGGLRNDIRWLDAALLPGWAYF